MLASEISDEFLDAVEADVGHSSFAWDMVDPKEIIAAVIKQYRIALLNDWIKDAGPVLDE